MQDACVLLRKKTGETTGSNKKEGIRTKVNTVDIIDQNVYESLANEAERTDQSLRKYVNEQLAMRVEKEKFMRRYMPKLKKLAFDEGILFIKDSEEQDIAKIGLSRKEGLVHCTLCDSDTCIHVMYALAMPELGRLEYFNDKPKS